MAEAGENKSGDLAPIHSGGGGIDATDPKDQAAMRKAMTSWPARWRGITPERKEKWVAQLVQAGDAASDLVESAADAETRLSAIGAMTSVVRTAAMIEGQNQNDDHLRDKNERLDAGKATENVNHGVKFIRGVDGEGI